MAMTIATPEDVTESLIGRLMAVYGEASPQDAEERYPIFRRHLQREGLVLRFAIAHGTQDEIVGFAYGMTGRWDEWWFRHILPYLTDEQRTAWASDCFVFTELHVAERARGQGIGGALHDAVIRATSHVTALLTVRQSARAARGLYANRGWERVADGVRFPNSSETHSVLGLRLDPA